MKICLNFLLIFLFLFTISGCGEDSTSNPDPKTCDPACSEWETCSDDQICVLAQDRCISNDNCETGEVCNLDTHYCEEDTVECTTDNDCTNPDLPVCENGVCVADVQPECVTDNDCTNPDLPVCENGVCVADVQPECTDNSDCTNPDLPACREGVCVDPCLAVDCSVHGENAHCIFDEPNDVAGCICNDGYEFNDDYVCVSVNPECVTDNDCTNPDLPVCENGVCVADVQPECVTDNDCTNPDLPVCENGVCVADVQPECVTDNDCTNPDLPVCLNNVCVAVTDPCINFDCSAYDNTHCEADQNGDAGCYCDEGFALNAEGTACVEIPDCTDDEIGNDFETADTMLLPYDDTHQSCTDNRDYFMVDLVAGDTFTVNLTEFTGDIDILLLNAPELVQENLVASSQQYGDGVEETFTYGVTETGTYYLIVVPYGVVSSSYHLTADSETLVCDPACGENAQCVAGTCECLDGYEGDPLTECTLIPQCEDDDIANDFDNAETILLPYDAVNQSCTGNGDYFMIDLVAGDTLSVNLTEFSGDIDLYLTDGPSSENVVAYSEEIGDGTPETIQYTVSTTATYYLIVNPYNEVESSYHLVVTTGEIICDPTCGNNAECVAGTCECMEGYEGDPVAGCTLIPQCEDDDIANDFDNAETILLPYDAVNQSCTGNGDYFMIDLVAGDTLSVSLTEFSGDIDLYLTDGASTENIVAYSEEVGDGTPEAIQYTVPTTGTYYLIVNPYLEVESSYHLVATTDEITCDPACGTNAQCVAGTCECLDGYEGDPLTECILASTCEDDDSEPNNSVEDATGLELPIVEMPLQICADDVDIFSFNASTGDIINVAVNFIHANGDLDIALYHESDMNLDVASSGGTDDQEAFTYTAEQDGVYYLIVYGYSSAENSYTLNVSTATTPECTIDEDCNAGFVCEAGTCVEENQDVTEPNETIGEAALLELPVVNQSLEISSDTDMDYFKITGIQSGETLDLSITFIHADGDLDIVLYYLPDPTDPSTAVEVESSETVNNTEAIAFTATDEQNGTFVLEVFGYMGDTNPYILNASIQ